MIKDFETSLLQICICVCVCVCVHISRETSCIEVLLPLVAKPNFI